MHRKVVYRLLLSSAIAALALLTFQLAAGAPATATTAAAARSPVARHEVPPTVTVFAFIKAEGDLLRVLLRVPLEAMRDLNLPLRDAEFLQPSAMGTMANDAATMWLENYLGLYENYSRLVAAPITQTRVSLPGDRSFASWESALAHMSGEPVADSVVLPWRQALLDVVIEYPIGSATSSFSVEPELAHLGVRTTTVLRFVTQENKERLLQYTGNPGLVHLDPSWIQSAVLFIKLGFYHILGGIDHLLFLLCLVIPFRRLRPLVVLVTAFTVAHSITLIASALEYAPEVLWFVPFIETLIAASIVFMAFENIVGASLQRRWVITFIFGLIHGFGFSFFLRDSLQFAGSHVGASLLAFNVGVEMGQLLVLAVAIPTLHWLFKSVVAERVGTIIVSALVAHTAWHWTLERGSELLAYDFTWPVIDMLFAAAAMRWLMLLLLLAGVVALLTSLYGRVMGGEPKGSE